MRPFSSSGHSGLADYERHTVYRPPPPCETTPTVAAPIMTHRGAQKTSWIASFGVAVVLAGTVAWLLNKPPTADCNAEAPVDHAAHKILATKVVAQPWLGEHHVYGIFMVPNRYKHNKNYAASMTIRGFDPHFALGERSGGQYVDGVFAEPGHYLQRSQLQTRVALWFLVKGLFGDLRRPCNWTLVFIERSS